MPVSSVMLCMALVLWTVVEVCTGVAAAQTARAWTNLGLYGGWVYDIAVDPNRPDKMFAGTHMGDGLYRTEDGGRTWSVVRMDTVFAGEDTFKDHAVYSVKIARTDSNLVWAAHNYWVAVSADDGVTWRHIYNRDMQRDCPGCGGNGDNYRLCRSLAIDPIDANIVYVGTGGPSGSSPNGAIYKTADGGRTWRKLNGGQNFDQSVTDLAVDPKNPTLIWAVTNSFGAGGVYAGTLYRSADGGETWTTVLILDAGFTAVTIVPDAVDTVFTAGGYGIIRHYFDGSAWGYQWPVISDECRLASEVTIDPQNPQVIYAAWKNEFFGDLLPKISRSTDGGRMWETAAIDPNIANRLNTLAVHPADGRKVFGGDAGLGVIASTDGGRNWMPVNDGINAVVIYDVAVDPGEKTHLLAGTVVGVFEKRTGTDWNRLTPGETRTLAFHPYDSSTFYAGIYGAVMKTVDSGTTWRTTPIELGNIYEITIDPVSPDSTVFVALDRFLYRSIDGGDSFVNVLTGENTTGEVYSMNAVAIDPVDHRHVYAGGGNFFAPRVDGDLWESFDGGDTWARTGLTGVIVNDVLIDHRNPAVLYAGCGYSGGTKAPLFKSIDGGKSWAVAAAGIPPMPTSSIAAWGFPSGSLYTAGQGNIQRFDGSTWMTILDDANAEFWGLWGFSEENLYAVGSSGAIQRFDGNAWTAMRSGSDQRLWAVWGTGADDIYAAGLGGTILHFDGAVWSTMDSGTTAHLYGIWGGAPDAFIAVGEKGTILRYDGRSWSPMASGTTEYLDSVWGAASDRIFAVGGVGTILFYDGRSWTPMTSGTANGLAAVWGSSAVDVYAAGERGTLLHFDGSRWTPVSLGINEKLQAIWGDSSANVFVVGDTGRLLQFNGRSWRTLRAPGEIGQAVVDLEFHDENPDIVYAGTHASGVFLSPNQAGRWLNLGKLEHKVFAISVGSVYAGTQAGLLQCTGTGVIAGRLQNAGTREGIDGATVFTDLGVSTRSVNGEYMLVSPAGSCSVTAVADRHANQIATDVAVYGGDVTWVNLDMHSGVAGPVDDGGGSSSSSGGGYSCFIDAAGAPENSFRPLMWVISAGALIVLSLTLYGLARGGRGIKDRPLRFMLFFLTLALAMAISVSGLAGTLFQQVGIASSPNPVGSGARALGMGGAFIGVADDATAASWNPAGLIQLEKPELTVVGEYVNRREEFSSALRPEIENTGRVDATNLNYFAATLPFHFYRNMVASVNYQRLYDFKREFSHRLDFTQAGLDLVQDKHFAQDGSVGALGLAGAVEITPTLSLGATVNIWTDELFWRNGWDETFSETSSGTIGGVPASSATYIKDEYSRFRGLNANIGVLWNVIPALTVGAVLKTPFTATVEHTFEFRQAQTLAPPVDTVTTTRQLLSEDVDLYMPLSYGIGVAWRFSDVLTVDLDIYRTHWSDYRLEDGRGNKFSPITGLPRDQSDVNDTTQVRIGAEYLFLFPNRQLVVPLRAGIFYDPEPAQGGLKDFYGIALGSGLAYKRLIFDVAYNFRWAGDVDTGNLITTSTADVRQHAILASLIFHL